MRLTLRLRLTDLIVPFLSQFRAAPNLLTLMRLFIIPFLVIEILDGHYVVAFALFVLAGISDALDGLLARMVEPEDDAWDSILTPSPTSCC